MFLFAQIVARRRYLAKGVFQQQLFSFTPWKCGVLLFLSKSTVENIFSLQTWFVLKELWVFNEWELDEELIVA